MPVWVAYALPSVIGTAVALGTAVHAWSRPGPARRHLVAFALATAWWCAGQFTWLFTDDAGIRTWLGKLQYLGITATPVLWLHATLAYTGRRAWLAPWRRRALWIVPFLTVALAFTNELHGLVWRRFEPIPGVPKVSVVYGAWFALHAAYSYALVLLGTVTLALRFATSPHYRGTLAIVLLAPATVLVANLLQITGRGALPIDPTPSAFAVSSAGLVWAIRRHHLFDLLPVARGVTLEGLRDGVVVLDGEGRVVDSNPAARTLLGVDELLGRRLAGLLPAPGAGELRLQGRRVELRESAVEPGDGSAGGRVVLLRDVTAERDAQDRLLRAQRELEDLNRELERLAHQDALTGLANRRRLLARLDEEWARARRHARPLAFVLVDLDHFKKVNDERGHLVGDRVLQAAGQALLALGRPEDVPARYGGEELAVLLPETDRDGACATALRIREALRGLPHVDDAGQVFRVTASLGVASLLPSDVGPRDLVARADAALYHAKANGRDGVSRAAPDGLASVVTAG